MSNGFAREVNHEAEADRTVQELEQHLANANRRVEELEEQNWQMKEEATVERDRFVTLRNQDMDRILNLERQLSQSQHQLQESEKKFAQLLQIVGWMEKAAMDRASEYNELHQQKRDEIDELIEKADDTDEEHKIRIRQMEKTIEEFKTEIKSAFAKLRGRDVELNLFEAHYKESNRQKNDTNISATGSSSRNSLNEQNASKIFHIQWINQILYADAIASEDLLHALHSKLEKLEEDQKENDRCRRFEKCNRFLKTNYIQKIHDIAVNLIILVRLYPEDKSIREAWEEISNFNAHRHIEKVKREARKLESGDVFSEEIQDYPGQLFMKKYNDWIGRRAFKVEQTERQNQMLQVYAPNV